MRSKIYEVIETSDGGNASTVYDYCMMATIFISLVPMTFKTTNALFDFIDYAAAAIFSVDYLLRP